MKGIGSLAEVKSRSKALALVILVILAGLGGYQAWQATLRDCSFLRDDSCSMPCWQGLVPGKTTMSEAVEILRKDHRIRQKSLQEGGSAQNGGVTWFWRASRSRFQSKVSWKDGIVEEITVAMTCEVSVEQILDEYGPPEALEAGKGGIPEHWYWIIDLYYPSVGTQFTACTSEVSSVLEASTPVEAAHFYVPTSLEMRVTDLYGGDGSSSSDAEIVSWVLGAMRSWKGYGDLFEVYYSSPEDLVLE